MVRELRVTITTSTDTNGNARTLMSEVLADLADSVEGAVNSGTGKSGDIDEYGYEVIWKYKIREI